MDKYKNLLLNRNLLIQKLEKLQNERKIILEIIKKNELNVSSKNNKCLLKIFFRNNRKTTILPTQNFNSDLLCIDDLIKDLIITEKNEQLTISLENDVIKKIIEKVKSHSIDNNPVTCSSATNKHLFSIIIDNPYYIEENNVTITEYSNKLLIQSSRNFLLMDIIGLILKSSENINLESLNVFISQKAKEEKIFNNKEIFIFSENKELNILYTTSLLVFHSFVDIDSNPKIDFSFIIFELFKLMEGSIKYKMGLKDLLFNENMNFGYYFDLENKQLKPQFRARFSLTDLKFFDNVYAIFSEHRNIIMHFHARKSKNKIYTKEECISIFENNIKIFQE